MSKTFIRKDQPESIINYLNTNERDDNGLTIAKWFDVGFHIAKGTKLSETLEGLSEKIPHQIFLTARSSNFNIKDDEKVRCAEIVERKGLNVFVHTPYLLNLSNTDEYIVSSLKKHLLVCAEMKFKGCVVHVGKSVKKPIEEAINNMRTNILQAIEFATPECPLLLETPAGQGTELLTNKEEFMDFIMSINDDRLGVCIDTCHVFSLGYMPVDYINHMIYNEYLIKYLKLIHYNDSETECNSCVDRHAFLFKGKIPMEQLVHVAFIGKNYNIPLVIEYST
jgi:endonuclease IV